MMLLHAMLEFPFAVIIHKRQEFFFKFGSLLNFIMVDYEF